MSAEELLFANELGEEHDHLKGAFDVIMAGDCTVNVEIHDILIATVRQLLAPGGIFMYLAPRRGKSLGKFVKKARLESQFEVVANTDYDEKITAAHFRLQTIHGDRYDDKKNYPILVTIRNKCDIPEEDIYNVGMHGAPKAPDPWKFNVKPQEGAGDTRFWTEQGRGSYRCGI